MVFEIESMTRGHMHTTPPIIKRRFSLIVKKGKNIIQNYKILIIFNQHSEKKHEKTSQKN